MTVPYDELDPGIRQVVRWLNDNGFETSDSGDGVSKFEGEETMGCAMEFPNVAIPTSADKLISECNRLAALLQEKGVNPGPIGPDLSTVVCLQGSYDPFSSCTFISLWGLDDAKLAQSFNLTP